jgi:hypothetical protein
MKMTATKKSSKQGSQHKPKTTSRKWKDDSGDIDHPLIDNSPRAAAQAKRLESLFGAPVPRAPIPEEEEELMRGKFSEQPLQSGENQTGMPHQLKTVVESLSGLDISDVRVHYNSSEPAQLNALAYARGRDIHLGSGQEKHLPYEAWHVVQQEQGKVRPTVPVRGSQVNDDVGLERGSDVIGEKALQAKVELGEKKNKGSDPLYTQGHVAQCRVGDDQRINAFRTARGWQGAVWNWLFANFNNAMNDGQVLGQLLNNFTNRLEWVYSGINAALWSGSGDCRTLCTEFVDVAQNCFGIAATVNHAGNDVFVAGGGPIIGDARTGNVSNGAHWYFTEHYVVNSGGTRYDVLFGIPNSPLFPSVQWIGGGRFTIGGVTYARPPVALRSPTNRYAPAPVPAPAPAPRSKWRPCFITTACTRTMGLPDDCEELTVLRQFRDNYLRQKTNGQKLIEMYYEYSPKIVTAIHNREDEEEILRRLYGIIRECVDAIKSGDNEFAFKRYCNMMMALQEEYLPECKIPMLSLYTSQVPVSGLDMRIS